MDHAIRADCRHLMTVGAPGQRSDICADLSLRFSSSSIPKGGLAVAYRGNFLTVG
ncbi:MAG TPA: hypothetical protein VKQ72_01380 [Aggregatilineales bacterium]|nr:hypothetical protein [Aggregatilineales bacterium]